MIFPTAHALLIGIGSYAHAPQLNVPITAADASAVAAVLRDSQYCGYPPEQVTLLSDAAASRDGVLAALDGLAARAGEDDTVFVFYAGHGAYGDDGYYLTTHDTRLAGHKVAVGAGIREAELIAKLRAIKAKRLLLVVNACHSGEISPVLAPGEEPQRPEPVEGLTGTPLPPQVSAALLGTGAGRVIISACRENQYSFIGPGPLTLFTQALVDGLQGKGVSSNRGYISVFDLYTHLYFALDEAVPRKVSAAVRQMYGAKQEPELTILKGVGPFAVALYRGATTLGNFDASGGPPEGTAVREVNPAYSQAMLRQHQQSISGNAQVGAAVAGDVHGNVTVTQQGDTINTSGGDNIRTGDISGTGIAIGRGAQSSVRNVDTGGGDYAQIGNLTLGDLAGRDIVKPTIILDPDEVSVEAQRRRSQILAIVGVRVQQDLDDARAAAAKLELGITMRPDAVPLAPGLRLQQRAGAQALPAGTTVAQVFDQAGGRLLILGAPGGGKSTLLLQLAAVLLDRARSDPAQPVPVLLNLSSWAAEGKPLAAWLVTALGDTYRIPKKIAEELVQRGRLALLLDGLDEVDPARRDACVQAINAYRREHLTPLAVCSRTEEYGRLAGQLELEAAIELRPLADDQVAAALVAGGDRLAGLRAAWARDADLRDLLRTPLLLKVATLAYSDAAPTDTDEPWSRRLFPAFVERALRRRGDAQRYDHAKTLHWLRWLAQTLEAQQLSELYLERMQPGWLPEAQHGSFDRLAGLSRGVTIGLAVGCVVAAVTPILAVIAVPALSRELAASTWWLIMAGIVLGFTLLMSLVALRAARRGPVEGIQPIDMLVIDDRARRRAWLAGGAAAIVGVGLFSVTEGFPGGIVSGLALGVLMLTLVLAQSIAGRDEDDALRTRPNQGIAASLRNAALLSLGGGIPVMIGMGSLITLILGSFLGSLPGLLFGLGIALFMWSFFGGESYTKHMILRSMLTRAGHAPLRYVAFLDYSVALLLLRRVGGGYAFQHRLLRDYLGALSDEDIADLAARAGR